MRRSTDSLAPCALAIHAVLIAFLCAACGPAETAPGTPASTSTNTRGEAPGDTRPTGPGAVETASFYSEALGVDKNYYVYLPAGYDTSDTRYPVLYYLHGLTGWEANWAKHMGLPEAADRMGLQAIVIMPDGDDSFYVNWVGEDDHDACLTSERPFGAKEPDMKTYCVKQPRYSDYLARDLVAHVDATYRTLAQRSARGIGGLSMGGYGALVTAMRHRDLFASAASHSGLTALLYKGPFPYERGKAQLADDISGSLHKLGPFASHFEKVFGTDLEHWRAHDPAVLAGDLQDGDLAIYIDCGTEDEFRFQHGASYLHEVLDSRGVRHEFTLLPGKHDRSFWRARIGHSLAFHMKHLR